MVVKFPDGYALCADSTDPKTQKQVESLFDSGFKFPLIIADPPYGNIVKESWDSGHATDRDFSHSMIRWTVLWSEILADGGAFYVWGGIGKPNDRPFFRYLVDVEKTNLKLANLITWSKRRAYGIQHNYLFTREECAYLIKSNDIKKPLKFNVPLLAEERGYAGYNKKYPAKSKFKRRTNVWTDVTEIFRGKIHPTQKSDRVIEIPIEIHTDPTEWVLDPFAGAGTTALAARKLGRRFVVIERDPKIFKTMTARL